MQQRMLIQTRKPTIIGSTQKQKRQRRRRVYALLGLSLAGFVVMRA
jgi:hypothetical protein